VSIFEDAWNTITKAAGGVVDVAGDVFDAIPGSGPLKDLVNGPLRDFAKTPTGMTILRSIATAMYGPLANSLVYWGVPFGAQLATIAWSTPGLLRGERFDEAWMLEFRWRAEKTAEIVGPGILDTFGAQLQDALDQLASQFGVGDLVNFTAEQLAKHLGIRVDVAEYAIALWNRVTPPPRDMFDPRTGRRYTPVERSINRGAIIESFTDARAGTTSAIARLFGGTPAPATTTTPITSSGSTTSSPTRSTTRGDLALALTIVAAAGALVWWHREESRR
jgi:hypothetical protein